MRLKMSPFSCSLVIFAAVVAACRSQNFDPNMDDTRYLDTIQDQLHKEVVHAHRLLVNQTKILQQVTRSFIEIKIKENLFRAVRARVEEELEVMAKVNETSNRQARQDGEEDDESSTPGSTTTRRPRPGLLPQLASVVSAIFGSDVNVTQYVKSATFFLPQDVGKQVVSVVSLIDPNRFTSTSTTTQAPTLITINGTTYAYIGPSTPNSPGTLGAPVSPPINQLTNNQVGGVVPIQAIPGVVANPAFVPPAAQGNVADIYNQVAGPPPLPNPVVGGATTANQPAPAAPSQGQGTVFANHGVGGFPSSAGNKADEESEDEDNSSNPEDEESSVEDDLPAFRDDLYVDEVVVKESTTTPKGYLDEYPSIKYAVNFFNRLAYSDPKIPTTTEWVNKTANPDYYDDDSPSTPPSRLKTIVQSGVYLYEGAREAYQLLQQINQYLDKVNERVEGAGYGADTLGIDVIERER